MEREPKKDSFEKRRIKGLRRKIDEIKKAHGDHPGLTHTYYAGWDLGYFQGRLSILEDMEDEREEGKMIYKALVTGRIFFDEETDDGKDIEIFTFIGNDEIGTGVFDDVEIDLLDQIEIGDSMDYYFTAVVESQFERTETLDGVDYDVIHEVTEIKTIADAKSALGGE